jgi:UDP-N-acetylglucosamine--N-acetylmuramyl-(pentapeptide) pyrophosphoryl-undecaprenol N-acetylglucosamine transferase
LLSKGKAQQSTVPKSGGGNAKLRCIIAGGGTGGHLFPGIAVAKALQELPGRIEVLFVVGRRGMESEIPHRCGYPAVSIDVEGLKGRGWKKRLGVLFGLPQAFWQAAGLLRSFSPALVLGMGAYSAGPVCLMARCLGIPTAVHEQNSYPGLTNRLLARIVDRVFISFEQSRPYLKARSVVRTGNPVRAEMTASAVMTRDSQAPFTVLVVGGSQGAMAINRAFAEAFSVLARKGEGLLRVIHQTGQTDYERVAADYQEKGLHGDLIMFIRDMAGAYQQADLVISRAGATTIFELAAAGKPAVLIPYPHAANQHQEMNARTLVEAGAAEMILQKDLNGEKLARLIDKYRQDQAALAEMQARARGFAKPDAAQRVAAELVSMLQT